MAVDLDNWAPRNIIIIPNDQPGKIVSAEYWSSLWQSVIEQGDYGQDTLKDLIDRLNITAWHPTEAAVSVSNPEIYTGGAVEVSGQLSELKAFADQIIADLNATAWHPTDAAVSIKNPAIYGAGATTVKGQLSELKSHMDAAEADLAGQTVRLNDLYDGTAASYNALRLGGQLPSYWGTVAQITNLQGQIDAISAGAISAFSHNDISNRDVANAHPTSAITGLSAALSTIGVDIDNLEAGTVAAGSALKLDGQLPAYYAKASDLSTLSGTVSGLTHAGLSDKNNTASHLASAIQYASGVSVAQKIAGIDATISSITGDVSELAHNDLLGRSTTNAHPISAITGLQTALNGKAATSHGTHVSYGTSAVALTSGGTGTAGTSSSVSRSDHKHTLPAYPVVTLSSLGVTATAAELNKLDGITATMTELNYTDGVTSAIQTQLNAKQKTITYGTANPSGGVNGDVYIKY